MSVFTVTTTKKRTAKTDYEFYGIKCIVEANGYMEGRTDARTDGRRDDARADVSTYGRMDTGSQ